MEALKRTWYMVIAEITLILIFAVGQQVNASQGAISDDSLKVASFSGKILDNNSKRPVVFANVFLEGTSIGTVTNIDGDFLIKIPKNMLNKNIGVNYIGYENKLLPFSGLATSDNIIYLNPSPIPIKEVIVRTDDPKELLRQAMNKVPENYQDHSMMNTCFYRETVKQNKKYVAVSEAILDIYKAPYNTDFLEDRVKVFKGRKSQDVLKMDTIIMKIQGGPKTILLLDVVKNPFDLFSAEAMNYYDYIFEGIVLKDGRETYIIEFDQKDNVDLVLYQGKIYLDVNTLAIAGLDFSISEKRIDKAAEQLVRKKPISMKINVLGGHYLVNYREIDGKWFLNHVRSEAEFSCKWDKKLFKSNYTTMLEMAVTDRDTKNIERFKYRESEKISNIFVDQLNYFEDEDYWGNFNVIVPDESIEEAITKINKKLLKRKNSEL